MSQCSYRAWFLETTQGGNIIRLFSAMCLVISVIELGLVIRLQQNSYTISSKSFGNALEGIIFIFASLNGLFSCTRFGVVATVVVLLLGIPFSLISMLIDPWLLAYFSQPTAICIDYQHNNTFSGPYAKNVFYQDFVTHRCSNSDPSAFPTTCHCTFAPMEANPPCWNFTSTVIEPIAVSKNCEAGFFQGFLPAYAVVTIFEALGALSASILLVVCCISLCCPVYVVGICVEKHQHQQQQPETFEDDGNRRLEVMPVRSNTTTHNPISTSREGTNVEASRRDLTDDVEMVLLRYSS